MRFITVSLLRRATGAVRKELAEHYDMIVTDRGRPFALLALVDPDHACEDACAVQRALGIQALARAQASAKAQGMDKMTTEEIDAFIAKVRSERRTRERNTRARKGRVR